MVRKKHYSSCRRGSGLYSNSSCHNTPPTATKNCRKQGNKSTPGTHYFALCTGGQRQTVGQRHRLVLKRRGHTFSANAQAKETAVPHQLNKSRIPIRPTHYPWGSKGPSPRISAEACQEKAICKPSTCGRSDRVTNAGKSRQCAPQASCKSPRVAPKNNHHRPRPGQSYFSTQISPTKRTNLPRSPVETHCVVPSTTDTTDSRGPGKSPRRPRARQSRPQYRARKDTEQTLH